MRDALAPLQALRQGLVEPSALSLVVCFLLLATNIALFLTFAAPEHLRPSWIGNAEDSAWATYFIHHPGDADIAIVGASGTRESMDQATLADDLGKAPLALTTSSQVSFDTVALAAELPASIDTVVIGLTPNRVLAGMDRVERTFRQPSFGFVSPTEEAEYTTAFGWKRARWGVPAIDRRAFYLLLLKEYPFATLRRRTGKRIEHMYRNKPQRRGVTIDFEERSRSLEQMSPIHFGVYARLIELLRADGKRVVVLQGPSCRTWLGTPEEASIYARYDELMAAFISRTQVPFWNLDAEAGLTCDDFIDPEHLRHAAAQEAYSHVLARRIRALRETP